MYFIVVTLLLVTNYASSEEFDICCSENSYIILSGQNYSCVQRTDTSKPVHAKFCNEGDTSSGLNKVKTNSNDYFPKCCPLDYQYNDTTRSCFKSENIIKDFLRGNFLKIGFPECNDINDDNYESLPNYQLDNLPKGKYCADQNDKGGYTIRRCRELNNCNDVSCLHKCCDENSYLFLSGKKYICVERNTTTRLTYLNNKRHDTDARFCIDGDKEFAKFRVDDGFYIKEETIEDYFPKCCPLNYQYNSAIHSCVQKENITKHFFNEAFVKIGLVDCEVIYDYNLDYLSEINYYENLLHVKDYYTPKGRYCIDENNFGGYVVRACRDINVCNDIRCVHRCCPDGQSYVERRTCRDTFTGLDLNAYRVNKPEEPFATIHDWKCNKMYLMSPKRYNFFLDERGSFHYFSNATNSMKVEDFGRARYCMEHLTRNGVSSYETFFCFPKVEDLKFVITKWAKIVSCVFLVLTIVIYFVMNETKTLFGKTLINYSFSLLVMFSTLIYVQFTSEITDRTCYILGSIGIYLTETGFTWLNVMCFDIWWTFGSPKSVVGTQQRRKELRRLICYLLYGWGVPLILAGIAIAFSKTDVLPYSIHPFIGGFKCFLENGRKNNYGYLVFKDIPLLIMEIVNAVLFIKTITYCLKVKNEINKINDTHTTSQMQRRKSFNADKEKLVLICKLSVIMGFLFLFEVVSAFYDFSLNSFTKYLEIVWDTVNCLQGLYIFIIFICKKKMYQSLKLKLKITESVRKVSTSSTKTTEVTLSSNQNTTPILRRK